MSYQQKRIIVSIITGALVLAAYCFYAFGQFQSGAVAPGDLRFWAFTILKFIGIGIVGMIIVQIVFHILISISIAVQKKIQDENFDDKEIEKSINYEMVEDEMDKLIDLKSSRISIIFAGFGFIAGLISLILNYSPEVMINLIFISFSLGSILEGFAQLYFYNKGVNYGKGI